MYHSKALAGSILLGLLCAWPIPIYAQNTTQHSAKTVDEQQTCKQPACFAGDDGNKSCYICEYGQPNQHTVCTDKGSKQDKDYAIQLENNRNKDECPTMYKNRGIMGSDRPKNQ
jgi:hypothetical protein